MKKWLSDLFPTTVEISDRGMIHLAQSPLFFFNFFLTICTLLSLRLNKTSSSFTTEFQLYFFPGRNWSSLLCCVCVCVVFQVQRCMQRRGLGCVTGRSHPHVLLSGKQKTEMELRSCWLLPTWFLIQGWHEAGCPVLPFWPSVSHHRISADSYQPVWCTAGCSPHILKRVTFFDLISFPLLAQPNHQQFCLTRTVSAYLAFLRSIHSSMSTSDYADRHLSVLSQKF